MGGNPFKWCVSCLLVMFFIVGGLFFFNIAGAQEQVTGAGGIEASECRVVQTYEYPGFKVVQFYLAVLSHYSYMVVSEDLALVVDPVRDPFAYLDYAMKHNLKIIGVYLTHNFSNLVTGHLELSSLNGCPIYIGGQSDAVYKHTALKDGSRIKVGWAEITIFETPGPGPDNTCGLVAAGSAPDKPVALFSGNTLLAGSVGLPVPELSSTPASTLASDLYDAWVQKLSKLPDDIALFPSMGGGSFCEPPGNGEPVTTLGAQRETNPYLQHQSRGEFMAAVLKTPPIVLPYFRHNGALNRQGPDKVDWNAAVDKVKALRVELADPKRYVVVDVREYRDFAAGHIPGAINIGLEARFESSVGIMVPWTAKLLLCGSDVELKDGVQRLHRVGYTAKGIVWDDWKSNNLPMIQSRLIKARDLNQKLEGTNGPLLLDVRLPRDSSLPAITGALHFPLTQLTAEPSLLSPDQKIVTVCDTGYYAAMAMSVLERNGFLNVSALDGGGRSWAASGLPVAASLKSETIVSSQVETPVLPESISARVLNEQIQTAPGQFQLVDIRPPDEFADYHLPGAVNRDISEVIGNPAYLSGEGPLVLVDRDGTSAMAAGGILSTKTRRKIQVLSGGLEAFWRETVMEEAVKAMPLDQGAPRLMQPQIPAAPAPLAPAAPPQKPKSKSAGC